MTTARVPGQRVEPSTRWMFGASSWLLLVLVPGGAMAWLAFGILAAVGRRRSWWFFAVGYTVAALICGAVDGTAGGILQGTLTLIILVHALIVNPAWLNLLWARRENGLTMTGNRRTRPTGASGPRQREAEIPQEAEKLLAGAGTARSDYLAGAAADAAAIDAVAASRSGRSGRRSRRSSSSVPVSVASAEPAEPIDVNTVGQRELSRLTGFDRKMAKAMIADRTEPSDAPAGYPRR